MIKILKYRSKSIEKKFIIRVAKEIALEASILRKSSWAKWLRLHVRDFFFKWDRFLTELHADLTRVQFSTFHGTATCSIVRVYNNIGTLYLSSSSSRFTGSTDPHDSYAIWREDLYAFDCSFLDHPSSKWVVIHVLRDATDEPRCFVPLHCITHSSWWPATFRHLLCIFAIYFIFSILGESFQHQSIT